MRDEQLIQLFLALDHGVVLRADLTGNFRETIRRSLPCFLVRVRVALQRTHFLLNAGEFRGRCGIGSRGCRRLLRSRI